MPKVRRKEKLQPRKHEMRKVQKEELLKLKNQGINLRQNAQMQVARASVACPCDGGVKKRGKNTDKQSLSVPPVCPRFSVT